ncbi:hypothetical protein MAPG_10995 [Magnaporthiopsis poae ATCC 64411]|uniref:tRNA (uracil-O(2)-)-methyltransferase n=1 Tax=Magnaporthiopsis poae (strain ATCC 64411 / 73-15) TaxID=644358 RepID=A0A0C4EE30_MAGP6|nr:hypothetical protein MAPG_10995 [Magnaporthiopsis poae ATCC 64411]
MDGSGAEEYADDAEPLIVQVSQGQGEQTPPRSKWLPVCRRLCEFNPTHFCEAMLNAIRNPNLLSSWLFRADLLAEHDGAPPWEEGQPGIPMLRDMRCERAFVRRLIPRNTKRDSTVVQTCPFYGPTEQAGDSGISRRLVLYLPHVSDASEVPYYHPQVTGVGLLHEWDARLSKGIFSVHYRLFDNVPMDVKLQRTALNILSVLHKLGQGQLNGYVKRVHHDILVPQPVLQNRYSCLKDRYAKRLVDGWLETTDPSKHVFEDLGIAAFLMELWAEMYKGQVFPGFVDIGTGNGLLVHILNSEGFRGWGFDARSRKSWNVYNGKLPDGQEFLRELVLLPSLIQPEPGSCQEDPDGGTLGTKSHDGIFPKGTFIISNHADELTPWTPVLAAASDCPFIAIPCCSHNLGGAKFRAPLPKDKTKAKSTYACLVVWVSDIAADCGWEVETEMLRIPSTRNTAIVGRRRAAEQPGMDMHEVIAKHGGARGYRESALRLMKDTSSGGH